MRARLDAACRTTLRKIAENQARFLDALRRADPLGMALCYTPDALLLPPGYPVVAGRDAIEAFWWAGIEAGLRGVQLDASTIETWDDGALEVGRATVRLQPELAPRVGKYVIVHRLQPDGSWRRAVDIFNDDAVPNDGAARREAAG